MKTSTRRRQSGIGKVQRPCGRKRHEEDVGGKGSQHDWDGGQDENVEGSRNQTEQALLTSLP